MLERQVVTLSPYVREGEIVLTEDGIWQASPAEYEQAQTYIETLLADPNVPLPPAIVLDIGQIREHGWAVVEANTSWGAGIYGCDPTRVLSVVARACVKRDQLTENDALWALKKVELI